MIKHGRGEITNGIEIIAAYDVTNPLFGPNGAARVYGPQKGASPDVAEQLDRELQSLAQRTGKIAEANTPGAGSGGGMGFGLLAFFGATLRNGFELIADTLHLPDASQRPPYVSPPKAASMRPARPAKQQSASPGSANRQPCRASSLPAPSAMAQNRHCPLASRHISQSLTAL